MIHPIPSGTRDVLPDEMRELRAITDALRAVFERARLRRGLDARARVRGRAARRGDDALRPAYRVFDDHGEVLALRADMTVPIARLVATRYPTAEPPLRFCYFAPRLPRACARTAARCASSCRRASSWSARPAPDGTAEALDVLCEALDAVGLRGYRDRAGRRRAVPGAAGAPSTCPTEARGRLLHELATRDFVGLEREVGAAGRSAPRPPTCWCACRSCAAAPEVARRRPAGPLAERARRPARDARACSSRARRRARDLRPRPRARAGLLHGRGLRGLRPGARRADRRRRALRRPARALRPAAARGRLRARRRPAAPRAGRRGARRGREHAREPSA